ncbi:hypothetical protein EDB92DRAFT_576435 [Lactarius akahatsu]|uniref:Uncharacterized protein n=1 Tax=Lactarius akahatsu TaxID=416441 RepID=A0AAD4LKJ3_9AGAM|nr:hypothetical protein EDB92DRAFT_576435 [Lactarius akahatsu]
MSLRRHPWSFFLDHNPYLERTYRLQTPAGTRFKDCTTLFPMVYSMTTPWPSIRFHSHSAISPNLGRLVGRLVPVERQHAVPPASAAFVHLVFLASIRQPIESVTTLIFFMTSFAWLWTALRLTHHRLDDIDVKMDVLQHSIEVSVDNPTHSVELAISVPVEQPAQRPEPPLTTGLLLSLTGTGLGPRLGYAPEAPSVESERAVQFCCLSSYCFAPTHFLRLTLQPNGPTSVPYYLTGDRNAGRSPGACSRIASVLFVDLRQNDDVAGTAEEAMTILKEYGETQPELVHAMHNYIVLLHWTRGACSCCGIRTDGIHR